MALRERTNQLTATGKNAVMSGAYIWPLHVSEILMLGHAARCCRLLVIAPESTKRELFVSDLFFLPI
jgi:hypothetical protein